MSERCNFPILFQSAFHFVFFCFCLFEPWYQVVKNSFFFCLLQKILRFSSTESCLTLVCQQSLLPTTEALAEGGGESIVLASRVIAFCAHAARKRVYRVCCAASCGEMLVRYSLYSPGAKVFFCVSLFFQGWGEGAYIGNMIHRGVGQILSRLWYLNRGQPARTRPHTQIYTFPLRFLLCIFSLSLSLNTLYYTIYAAFTCAHSHYCGWTKNKVRTHAFLMIYLYLCEASLISPSIFYLNRNFSKAVSCYFFFFFRPLFFLYWTLCMHVQNKYLSILNDLRFWRSEKNFIIEKKEEDIKYFYIIIFFFSKKCVKHTAQIPKSRHGHFCLHN